jgi:cytochrome P450/NADPH-cytochrome P450 reductase
MKLCLFGSVGTTRTRSFPDAVNVLKDNECFGKYIQSRESFGLGIFTEFLGEGLASVDDGPRYKEMRKLMNPAFRKITTDGMVSDFASVAMNMVDYVDNALGDSKEGVLDWQATAMAATVDSIGRLHFKTDLKQTDMLKGVVKPSRKLRNVAQTMAQITTEGQKLLLPSFVNKKLPYVLPGYKAYHGSIESLDFMVENVMEKRRSLGFRDTDNDALGEILKVYGTPGYEWMTPAMVRDQVVTLFFAGSDTTASTVAWTLFELSREPEVLRAIQREVDDMVSKKCNGDPAKLGVECLESLPLLQGAINETLRLYPPAPIIGRDCVKENSMVEGYTVKEKDVVIIDIYALHRDPKLWKDPTRWNPQRWEEGRASVCEDAFVPFAAGQRACIGKYFAIREAQVFLSLLLHKFSFSPAPAKLEPDIAHAITITSLNGINLVTEKRKQSPA